MHQLCSATCATGSQSMPAPEHGTSAAILLQPELRGFVSDHTLLRGQERIGSPSSRDHKKLRGPEPEPERSRPPPAGDCSFVCLWPGLPVCWL